MTDWKEAEKLIPQGKYLSFGDEGVIEAVFMGFDQEDNPFATDSGNKIRLVLHLKCDDGVIRDLAVTSKRLLLKLVKVAPQTGDRVRLMREGERFETQYLVRIIKPVSENESSSKESSDLPF